MILAMLMIWASTLRNLHCKAFGIYGWRCAKFWEGEVSPGEETMQKDGEKTLH